MSDVRHSYLPCSCGRHTTWRCHCGEVTSHGRRREGAGNQIGFQHLDTAEPCLQRRRKLLPRVPEMQTVAIAVCRSDLTSPRDFWVYSVAHIWPLSTNGFRHPPTRRLVRRPHTIGDVAGSLTGAVDGTIEPEFRTIPGFSTQRDREIEHRRHPTPPTIDQTRRNHQARRAWRYRSVTSVDGTRLRAWDNNGHGVPVLICNGLGTPHHAWPDIRPPPGLTPTA